MKFKLQNNLYWICFLILLVLSCHVTSTLSKERAVLKDVFKNYFLIGAALNQFQFTGRDTLATTIVKEQFNSISPENVLKWMSIHPQPDSYNFKGADSYVEFGQKNNMFIVGHTLIWHSQVPRWVFQDDEGNAVDRETLLNRMHDHIQTVVGRYKGKIHGWDVVNEALNEDGTLRQTQWMKTIGEDYIEKAFQFAHEADPDAELYYNDYSLANAPKRNGAIKLIKNLQSKGIYISGVGLQGHYKMDWPSTSQLDSSIKAFAQLGIKVMITELDIDVLPQATFNMGADVSLSVEAKEKLNPFKNELPDSVQQLLAERYTGLFNVFVNNSKTVSRVTLWGVTDGNSWLNNWPVRGRTNYPLLFDRNGNEKPAYNAVINIVEKQNN